MFICDNCSFITIDRFVKGYLNVNSMLHSCLSDFEFNLLKARYRDGKSFQEIYEMNKDLSIDIDGTKVYCTVSTIYGMFNIVLSKVKDSLLNM